MEDDKSSSKWAAEFFDFLRLFQRVGGQLSGLLLLEIGWALLLSLVTKLSSTDSAPILGIPLISVDLQIYIIDVRLTSVFSIGALLIALGWLFNSETYLYFFLPLGRVLRFALIIVTHIVFIVLAIIVGFPSFLLSLPYELYLIGKWEKAQNPEKLKQTIEKNGKEAVLNYARTQIKFKSSWLLELLGDRYIHLLTALASVGKIGLAPIFSYSFEEDRIAAKAPLQIFANAIGRLRLKLGTLDVVRYIQFRTLPSIIKIETYERACQVRKWLGLDALLWGSYISATPPKIWLNIEQALTALQYDKRKSEDRENYDPFRPLLDFDQYMLVIDQNDPFDAYIALLIALMLSLRARQTHKFTLYPKGVDKLYYSLTDEDAIFTSLIRDALFSVSSPIAHELTHPPAKQLLVNMAGKWVAKQLSGGYLDKYAGNFALLKEVVAQCIRLYPQDANAYYRLATLHCLLGDEDGARKALITGQEKDKELHWLDEYYLESMAIVELSSLGKSYTNENVQMAKLVSYAYRAISKQGDSAKESILSKFKETIFYDLREIGMHTENPSVSEKIFYELLGIKFAKTDV